jgi:rRNA biogenesis protein RRP5
MHFKHSWQTVAGTFLHNQFPSQPHCKPFLFQEIKLGDQPVIRGLFERAICLELPAKKMKFLFKKYLEYEKQHGDEASVDRVKKAAMDYVENKLS